MCVCVGVGWGGSTSLMHSRAFAIVILCLPLGRRPYGTDLPSHMSGADNVSVI